MRRDSQLKGRLSGGNGEEAAGAVRGAIVLEPRGMIVRSDGQGRLAVTLPDGKVHTGVRLHPAFPISRHRRFIFFYTEEGRELGLLQDPRHLDAESRQVVLAECDQVYFMPRITRVLGVDERGGLARWQVETDRGRCAFQIVSRGESVWHIGRRRLVIRDADGNRYMIPDLSRLDRRSRLLVELNT